MAEWRTFSTAGAMRLLVLRSVVMAAPAFWPRIRSTTSRAFCGEIRMYLASALASMKSSLCRLRRLLGGRLHGVAFERPGRRKLAELVSHHVLRDVDGNELFAVVDRDGVADELGQNRGAARPGADDLLLVGRGQNGQL